MKKQTASMQDAAATAKILSEALPYLQRYSGAVVVVKFGGNAMGDDAAMAEFARDIVLLRQVGGRGRGHHLPAIAWRGGQFRGLLRHVHGVVHRHRRGQCVHLPDGAHHFPHPA